MKYILIFLIFIFSFQSLAQEKKKKGFSTLPGWSAGYRYFLDLEVYEKYYNKSKKNIDILAFSEVSGQMQ